MKFSIFYVLFSLVHFVYTQEVKLKERIDSIIQMKSSKPFNGIVLISEKGKVVYSKSQGYSDLTSKKKLNWNDQFVIGYRLNKQAIYSCFSFKRSRKGQLEITYTCSSLFAKH